MDKDSILNVIENNKSKYLYELKKFISYPSYEGNQEGITRCAEYLEREFCSLGFNVQFFFEDYPILFAQRIVDPKNKTLLIYGHYDVKPPGDESMWLFKPFEAEINNGKIYGRGSADNKGQILAYLKAFEAVKSINDIEKLNLKFIIDSQEESGSKHFYSVINKDKELFKADMVVLSDGKIYTSRPLIGNGIRGKLEIIIEITGEEIDLHPGQYGNIARCALNDTIFFINKLYQLLNIELLHSDSEISPDKIANNEEGILKRKLDDEELIEKLSKPCIIISSINSYDHKCAMIPSKAVARIDMRLIENQDPIKLLEQIKHMCPSNITISNFKYMFPSKSLKTDYSEKVKTILKDEIRKICKSSAIDLPYLGISLPLSVFSDELKIPYVIIPFAQFDAKNHQPNENLDVIKFFNAISLIAILLSKLNDS
ncbi:Peptidase, M20/M25/M40 family [Candidatus Magnetomorum sp. HK-1]|nr:Peptidase, M20/M25/M40 family [Candidatus Magnetomorum sp. HK-1]